MSYLDWNRTTHTPRTPLPSRACDSSVHVFGAHGVGTLEQSRRYDPLPATLEDLRHVHERLGIDRAVLVQASIYGVDHTVLVDALARDPFRYRGVASVDDRVSDAELSRLHEAGVRGARYNMLSRSGARFDAALLKRTAARVAAMGWSLSLHGAVDDFLAHVDTLARLRLPLVIDNLAYFDNAAANAADGLSLLRTFLDTGNWWVKIARTDLGRTPPYDDTLALVQRIVALSPDRVIWGTDWPHVLYDSASAIMPNDGELVDLLARQVPDITIRDKILVSNPARLFGFED